MKTVVYQIDTYYNTILSGKLSANYYRMQEYCEPSIAAWCKFQKYDHRVIRPECENVSSHGDRWKLTMAETINTVSDFLDSDYDRYLFLDYDIYIPRSFSFPWQPGVIHAPSYGFTSKDKKTRVPRHMHLTNKIKRLTGIEVPDTYLYCVVGMDREAAEQLAMPRVDPRVPNAKESVDDNDETALAYYSTVNNVSVNDIRELISPSRIDKNSIAHFGGPNGKMKIRKNVIAFEKQ